MIFIMVQKSSLVVYPAQLDSFAYLICYEHDLGPYVHELKYDFASSTLHALMFKPMQCISKHILQGYEILVSI